MRKTFTLKYALLFCLAAMISFAASAQTTVFSDDFNRATLSPGGTPAMTYTTTLPTNILAATTANYLRLGAAATAPTAAGVSYVSGTTATYGSPYSSTLSANSGTITWTFNFRWNRPSSNNPAPPASGSYGSAIVLAGSSSTLTSGTGYAIIYGSSGTPDPIRLVAYTGGIAASGNTLTDICTSGASDLALTNNYASVRVTYEAATNKWSLYVRDDGASAWSDPSTGVTSQKGATTVNSTYTGVGLPAFGVLWSFSTTANLSTDVDNYKVTVTPPASPVLNSISPTAVTAGSGGFTVTANGSNFVSGLSTITWNGSSRTTTFVNSGQLTASIPASDITTAGSALVGVTTTGAASASGTQTITINPALTPSLTVSSALADFGSVCANNSVTNSFTLDGLNLDGSNITLTALPGFFYSESLTGTYTNTLSFSYSGTGFTGKQIFVRFTPTQIQSYNGNISLSGGGLSGINVSATASGVNTAPTVASGSNVVAGTSATLNGTIPSVGCSAVSSYGFEYSTTPGFVNGTGIQVTAVNLNNGAFSKTVSGLTAATTYFYKAFAVNNGGISYGTESSFATSSVVPVAMAAQPLLRYSEDFGDITNWGANFVSGIGANHFSGLNTNTTGAVPAATRITTATTAFTSGTSGGVQKGSGSLMLLATGSTDNSASSAVDFYMDFTGVNAGTLSFDWASVNNSTGDRNGSLRVFASTDGISFTEIAAADVLNFTNNVPSTGTVNSIALPASFNNSPTARLRFYYHNGTGGTTGSRPKISIDNLIVTGVAAAPCVTPVAPPTSLTFGNITETTINGNFLAASPAVNEYLVIMSVNGSLTSTPIDGQTYQIGDNVGDGTVIAKGSATSFTATGLTGSTMYNFFIFPVNSVCTGGPLYLTTNILTDDATTAAGLPVCVAPASQASNLVTSSSINSIQGSFSPVAADGYLVLQSTAASLSNLPVNGTSYSVGTVLGNATVMEAGTNTVFTASNLSPATQYYYYVFAYNASACVNGPAYNTASPLSASATTLPLPVCITPSAQPSSIGFNASNNSITATFNGSGSGYNYLVVMSTSSSLSGLPVDNTDYAAGNALGGGTVISNNTSTSFIATNLATSTQYYFFVFAANKNCTGGTKYLTALPLSGTATTTNAPVNNIYFGNLHAHSDYSDGNKDHPGYTPADDYEFASHSLGFDFLGISEHNHFSSLDNPGNELANYRLGVAQAAAFNATHSNFLALYGMEWGVISGGGHVVVYGDGLTDLFGWESNVNGKTGPNYDVYVPKSTYIGSEGLFKTVNDYVAKNAFATLAHPNNTDFNNLANIPYDAAADSAISGVAVESGPATSTNITYSNPASPMFYLWYYQKMLSKGYHLGPTIDHDNHNTTFGRTTAARTAVIAPALTQSDIIKAVKDMHFYATEDVDAKVDFTINTRIMGSVFEDRNAPSISVNLTDATTNTSNALIRVMAGIPGSGQLPVVIDSVFGSTLNYVDNSLANHATGYYYIDITNGSSRIVTSPIWYTRTCASSSDTTANVCGSFNWYGTVYTSSTVVSKVFTTAGGCDSTVTLHLTVNNSPASAAIGVTGSDTGCPGTGVGLTAAVNDGGNGAISSYQWYKDGNAVSTTSEPAYTALSSGSYSVLAINVNNCSILSGVQTVTVVDNTAPVPDIAVLPVITAECTAVVTNKPTATDYCAGTITATTSDPLSYAAQGTYTITWTYDDGNGNSTTQIQTVIVKDITAPVLVNVPADITVTCDNVPAAVSVTAADNCAITPVVFTETSTQNTDANTIGHYTYTITRTWSVSDAGGNSTSAAQVITVTDNTAPVITLPSNISVSTDAGVCGAFVTYTATATDNCSPVTISYSKASGSQFATGTTTVTVTATDVSGNTSSADFTVTVTDTEKPTVVAPEAYSVVNDAGKCYATIADIGTPVTSDNCRVTSVSNDHPSAQYPVGTTVVTWKVTDINGNVTDTATQTITVIDNELPVITVSNISANNTTGQCGRNIVLAIPETSDNCGVASISNDHPSTYFPVGSTNVTWKVTDNNGWIKTAVQTVVVKDVEAPSVNPVTDQVFCAGGNGMYQIPVLAGSDNCSAVTISYSITGTTTRSGNTNNASGLFNPGVSVIKWTAADASGNQRITYTTVTVNSLPAASITVSSPDNFCNKLVLTANTNLSGAVYQWSSGSSPVGSGPQLSLGQTNGDGVYSVVVTANGCSSAPASYTYQKQVLSASYTILALNKLELGENNTVASGSVGVIAANGEAEFHKNCSVASAGSFVKAKNISKDGTNILISNPVYAAATGITLPTMYFNTASTNGLPSKEVAQNSVSTVAGNYKNLTLKKGSNTTLTGNTFGTIRVEQGARVSFTATTLNIDKLQVVKGPRTGYSYVRFAPDTKVLISGSVTIGSQVYINPDNNKVTFYLGDKSSDDEKFSVKGGDTRVTANIYLPNGKLNVTGGYRYGDYGNGYGDCDRDDDDDRYYGQGNNNVYMTGLFIAQEVDGNGKNVVWNNFDCSAGPVSLMNYTPGIITGVTQSAKNEMATVSVEENLKVTVLPNPSTTYFTLKLESKYTTPVELRVMDGRGRVIDAKSKLGANSTVQIGQLYSSGTYYAELIQGTERKVVQLVKVVN